MDYFDILFAKTNGTSESTCYNEIESMLKSTVGHSSKNLLDIGGFDETQYNVHGYSENGYFRIVGTYQADGLHQFFRIYFKLRAGSYILSGAPDYSTTPIRIAMCTYTSNPTYYDTIGYDEGNNLSFTLNEDSNCFIAFRFQSGAIGKQIDLTLPVMIRSAFISDDTFEPYVTPTDEKKQDKPVELDSTVLTFNIAEIQSKYETLKFVIEYTRGEITTIEYNVVEVPTFIFGRGDTSYYKIFTFSAGYARDNFDAISFTESDGNVTVNPYTASSQNIIKIIGTPK